MITHTLKDLDAIDSPADRAKARGFIERAGMIACFGQPRSELGDLDQVISLSRREADLITSWSSPAGWEPSGPPPGLGKCLIKVGGRPGMPVGVRVTGTERRLHDTNARWRQGGDPS